MRHKAERLFASLVGGSLLTASVMYAETVITGQPIRIDTTTILLVIAMGLVFALIFWAGFFRNAQKPLVSILFLKSFGVGFVLVFLSVGASLLAGRQGGAQGAASLAQINVAGTAILWVLVSGLFYNRRTSQERINNAAR